MADDPTDDDPTDLCPPWLTELLCDVLRPAWTGQPGKLLGDDLGPEKEADRAD